MNANAPLGAANAAAPDKYHVYRLMLDLIGFAEGAERKRGYNETLAYLEAEGIKYAIRLPKNNVLQGRPAIC